MITSDAVRWLRRLAGVRRASGRTVAAVLDETARLDQDIIDDEPTDPGRPFVCTKCGGAKR